MSASTRSLRAPRHVASPRRRIAATGVALAAGMSLLGTGTGGPAIADSPGSTLGSAATQSAAVTNGSGITMTPSGTGLLGSITSALTAGVLNATSTLPNTTLSIVTTALTATLGLQATNASTRVPRPNTVDNYPTCNQQGWTFPNGNCYAVLNSVAPPTLAANTLLAVSPGTVQGYATGDGQGYVTAAGSSHPVLVVPGLAIDLGVASSSAQCTTAQVCTPAQAFTGGQVTPGGGTPQSFTLATGNALASVGGTTIADTKSITLVPNLISATANGNLLTFNVTLSLQQYLGILGTSLSALGAGLSGALSDNGSSITLSVTVGPGSLTGSSSAKAAAWGLDVGINLNADVELKLTTLAGALGGTIALKSGSSGYPATAGSAPNLADLKLAYSQATAGALLPDFVPPGLI